MKTSILNGSLALLLLVTGTWDSWVHRNALAAIATRRGIKAHAATPYDRSKYFTKAPRAPFVFVSRYTVTDDGLNHSIRMESTEAADSAGRAYWETHVFNPNTETRSTYDSASFIDTATGKIMGGFSRSRAEEDAGAPLMVPFGQNPRFVEAHRMPENNCSAPEPQLQFLRFESLTIGGVSYPTAVIQHNDDKFETTSWLSMTPGLGCLELKSITNFVNEQNAKGLTVREPVSLTLGEPDSRLTDLAGKTADRPVELIPIEKLDAAIKAAAKKYQVRP